MVQPVSRREYNRRYYQANRDRILAQTREYAKRPEVVERELQRYRQRRLNGYKNPQDITRKAFKEQFWAEQDGHCYLCGNPLPDLATAHLDHDHRCCPRHYFCRYCVRGLACERCNLTVGNTGDDPERLERIAQNLRAKLAEVNERLAAKPEQMTL